MNWVECCYLSSSIEKWLLPIPFTARSWKEQHLFGGVGGGEAKFTFYKCGSPFSSVLIWCHTLHLLTVSKGGWQLSMVVLQWVLYMGTLVSLHLHMQGRRETGNASTVHIYMYGNGHFYGHTSCLHLSQPNLCGEFGPWPFCTTNCPWCQTIRSSQHLIQTCLAFDNSILAIVLNCQLAIS